MIIKENYSEEHIRVLQKISKRDPGLIERTLYAFGLLEALAKVGLPFTFKGGTSFLLLLEKPMRLSTDIDIVVKPETDSGSRDVRTHIYAEDFSSEIAAMRAPKIIYMAACLLTDHVYEKNF